MRSASCTLGCLLAVLMPAVVISFYAQPKAVQFVESPGHVTSCQGCGPIVLQCSIAAQSTVANVPRPLLQWVVNETDLVSEVFSDASVQLLTDTDSATSQLTLPTPHTGHNGRYGCVARDGSDPTFCDAVPCVTATTLSNTATVQILADNVSVETVVYSGDCERAALLSCGVQGDFPTVWFRDRDVIQPNNQTEYLLPNGDLLVHHHGNSSHVYSCMGELQTTNATLSQYELHTVTPVTTLTPHTTVQVHNSLPILLTGDASTLVCTYERQNSSCDQPSSMPRWYHNGREMNAAELVHAGHVIRLERVGVADAGVYCCVVEGVESCTTLDIVERTNPDSSTRFIGSTDTTLHIPAPLHMPHSLLRWFHNGLEIKSHQGLSALNQMSEVTSALYGLYQLFIEQLDGTLTELTLTRSLPYGVSNPPGRPTLTELPRYNTAAARVEWTPPLYTGGVADPWFNIRHRGLSISHTLIRGKSSVIDLLEFNQNSVSVGVASDDGTELSEWGVATSLFLYTALCGDHDHVRAPPELSLSCVDGSVSIALTHTVLPARLYRAGDCMKNNQTLHVPLQPNVLLLSVAVGTQCGFEAAAAPASYPEGCATGERCQCFYPYNLEYTLPVFCNVTGTVQFNQSEYTVDEGTSEVQICLTAQGYDFSVIIETEAATATASDDYTPQIREFEFTADTLTHCLNVSVRDDVLVEGAETFRVTMTTDNPLVVIPTPSATVNIMDNDLVGVSFIQNSSLFLPFDTTTFEVCVFLEGQLEREVRVNLTSSIDDGAEASEMHFNSSRAIVCVNNTRNSTDGHLLLMLVTSDPQVRVSETGLSVYILQEQITNVNTTSPSVVSRELVTMTMVGVVTVTALVSLMLIVVLCTCIAWKRYKRKRYEKQIRRFGINKSEKFCSDFEDPVSVGPCVPVSADPDDITLYNEFFPGGSAHCSALSLDKAGGEFPLETGVTSEEILEHLERYTNSSSRYQQDSGIGEYLEQPVNCDFGSGFSGQSFSSYVHCKQYNCMCGACLASRAEGKSPTSLGKSPTNVGKSPPETVGCEDVFVFVTTLSTSLPELSSCDNNVNTSLSSSNCADT